MATSSSHRNYLKGPGFNRSFIWGSPGFVLSKHSWCSSDRFPLSEEGDSMFYDLWRCLVVTFCLFLSVVPSVMHCDGVRRWAGDECCSNGVFGEQLTNIWILKIHFSEQISFWQGLFPLRAICSGAWVSSAVAFVCFQFVGCSFCSEIHSIYTRAKARGKAKAALSGLLRADEAAVRWAAGGHWPGETGQWTAL